LVVISYVCSNICWYPLPYHYGYYNYNSYYVDRRKYNTTIINNTTVVVNPTPNPTPTVSTPIDKGIPQVGVITVAASDFGRGKSNFRIAPVDIAKKVLSETPSETVKPVLPTIKDLNGKLGREILAENPRNTRVSPQIKIGATDRTSGVSVGEELRKERIFGNRSPIEKTPRIVDNGGLETQPQIRNTGAIKRQPRSDSPLGDETPIRQTPEDGKLRNPNRIRSTGGNDSSDGNETQAPIKPSRNRDNREIPPPVYNPPQEERIERQQPPRREQREEPVRQQPQREEPRVEAPTRAEPRREEPVRQQPPPPKQEPQPEKPAAPNREIKVNKDSDNF